MLDGSHPIGGNSTHPIYHDDEFKATSSVKQCPALAHRIHDPIVGETVVLWADPQYRIFQIFTGSRETFPEHWNAIALEPMSGLANAYNNGDHWSVLSAQETFEG